MCVVIGPCLSLRLTITTISMCGTGAWGQRGRRTCFPALTGALDGGRGVSPCHLSILRNPTVALLCCLFKPMSHVEFKKWPCRLSLYVLKPCRISMRPVSRVEFKNWPCSPFDFRGQWPSYRHPLPTPHLMWPQTDFTNTGSSEAIQSERKLAACIHV